MVLCRCTTVIQGITTVLAFSKFLKRTTGCSLRFSAWRRDGVLPVVFQFLYDPQAVTVSAFRTPAKARNVSCPSGYPRTSGNGFIYPASGRSDLFDVDPESDSHLLLMPSHLLDRSVR